MGTDDWDEVMASMFGTDSDDFWTMVQNEMKDAFDQLETEAFDHGTVEFEDGNLLLGSKTITYHSDTDTLTEDNPDLVEAYSQDSVTYTRQ